MSAADTVVAHRAPVAVSRHVAFLALVIGTLAEYEHYSHIVTIPFISLFLVYLARNTIFASVEARPRLGALVMAVAIVVAWLPRVLRFDEETAWSFAILSMVATCVGAFILCYGTDAFRKASFALFLLVFMAPLPPFLLHAVIGFLQRASAEASAVLFELLGVPVFRQDFVFALPGLTIKVAEECSGIRSTLALFIVGLVAGHLYLRSTWAKTVLAVTVVPLAIVKNGIRIVVLSLLGIHVDPGFVGGSLLHRYSGLPVFALAFAILGAIIWLLQRSEARLWRRAAQVAG